MFGLISSNKGTIITTLRHWRVLILSLRKRFVKIDLLLSVVGVCHIIELCDARLVLLISGCYVWALKAL